MFAKLLKQEWRGCREVLGILCAIILGSGGAVGCGTVYLTLIENHYGFSSSLWNVLVELLMTAAVLAIGVCSAGGVLYLIWRYYQSRFADEGYLTFTLPVTHHQLLLSGILNVLLGSLLVMLTAFAAVVLAGLIYLAAAAGEVDWPAIFRNIWDWLPELWDGLRQYSREIGIISLTGVVSLVSNLMLPMTAVTIGAVMAKKHRLLLAVAVYYGTNMMQGIGFTMWSFSAIEYWYRVLYFPLAAGLITIAGGYWLMYWLQSKKLNLI